MGFRVARQVIVTALLLAIVGIIGVDGRALAQPLSPVERVHTMMERARREGSVPVIVRVRAEVTPEGHLGVAAAEQQRERIRGAQGRVLRRLGHRAPQRVKEFRHLPYVAMSLDAAGLEAVLADPDVVDVEEDRQEYISLAQSTPLIGATAAWTQGATGSGQVVAVLDTGVDRNHPFLANKVVHEACFSKNYNAGTYTVSTLCPNGQQSQVGSGAGRNCSGWIDGCEHGTHVAGIAAGSGSQSSGVAPDADIMAIQVFSEKTGGTSCTSRGYSDPCVTSFASATLEALEHVYDQRHNFQVAAVNLSLGGGSYSSHCDSDSRKEAIDLLRSVGIATVIATGNGYEKDAIASPACISSAISVGAASKSDRISDFSNSAPGLVDLIAPGEYIYSSLPGNIIDDKSGTSMATPHVAGAIAALRSRAPGASVDEIEHALVTTGTLLTDPGNGVRTPRINVDDALAALGTGGGNVGNDHFADAFALEGGSASGTSTGATKESGEPSHAGRSGGASVWWRWTAPSTAQVSIETTGSNFDTLLAVYRGSQVSSLTAIAANDDIDYGQGNVQSRVAFQAYQGITYQIAVDGYGGDSGSVQLRLQGAGGTTPPPPPTTGTPAITSPASGSVLSGATVTFQWNANGAAVRGWILSVGSSVGGGDIHPRRFLGGATSATVTGIPTDGRTVNARLEFHLNGSWQSRDFTYTAASSGSTPPPPPTTGTPAITSPASGSVLSGSTATFQWTANGASVRGWILSVGSGVGGGDIHPRRFLGGATSATVTGIPTDGRTVNARLEFHLNGSWQSRDFTYTAASSGSTPPPPPTTGTPAITSPAPGSELPGSTATFQWNANGTAVAGWILSVGSSVGGGDIHPRRFLGSTTSAAVTGLPTDGRTVHARLEFHSSGSWQSRDFTYTAAAGSTPPPPVTRPANDDFRNDYALSGDSASAGGTNRDATRESGEPYHAGRTGGHSVWWSWTAPRTGQATIDTAGSDFDTVLAVYTGTSVSSLSEVTSNDDIDGTLQSRVSFQAVANTRYYIAVDGYSSAAVGNIQLHVDGPDAPPPPSGTPLITSPAPGSVLPGSTVTFQWSAGADYVAEWMLWLGSTPNSNDYFATQTSGSRTSFTVTGLPTDGRVVYATLSWRNAAGALSGTWQGAHHVTYTATSFGSPTPRIPGNDNIENALSFPNWCADAITALGSNLNATLQQGESYHAGNQGGASVWWTWRAPQSGTVIIDTAGSDFDTLLAVYTGATVSSLTEIASNDDIYGTYQSRVSFQAVEGRKYRIVVDGYSGRTGDLRLRVQGPLSEPPPVNRPPSITSPAPGSNLPPRNDVLFEWTDNGTFVTEYMLTLGTTPGGNDIYSSGSLGTQTSKRVFGIPFTGGTIHARLFYRMNGSWLHEDFSYTAAPPPPIQPPTGPAMVSPAPGSQLQSSRVTFQWRANDASVDAFALWVGTSSGGYDVFNSGTSWVGLPITSVLVSGLPVNGRTVYVRLWWQIGGSWQHRDYTYTATTLRVL